MVSAPSAPHSPVPPAAEPGASRHLVFMTDLRVRDRRERFTEAILFKQAAQGASTGHATRAFSGLRRFASSVAVEVEPDKHDLGLVVRFPRERYSAP